MSIIKNLIKKFLYKFNLRLMHKYNYYFGIDSSIKKILAKKINKLVIFDIGANLGQSVERFRKYQKNAKIFSFEPDPKIYKVLELKKNNDPNLFTYNIALSNKKEKSILYTQNNSGENSLLKMNTNKLKSNIPIKIQCNTISSFCKEKKIKKIDILKIDTQGSEFNIIKGCGNFLKKIFIIEAEIIFNNTWKNSPRIGDLENYLKKYGFVIWDFPNIIKYPREDLDRIFFIDIIFVNLNLLRNLKQKI
jgi:FkbM family methyltransferase